MEQTKYPYAENLVQKAIDAQKNAYAPYSKFPVGAAILTKNKHIFTGCNIENASFPATICAERVAICSAVAHGERDFLALAVAAGSTPVTPCGICRQFFCEFGNFIIFMASSQGEYTVTSVQELLPEAFSSFESNKN